MTDEKHNLIGVIVVALSLFEVCLGFYSNAMWKPGKAPHILHDKLHWYIGRSVTLLALVNIALAFFDFFDSGSGKIPLLVAFFASLAGYLITGGYLSAKVGQVHEYNMANDNAIEDAQHQSKDKFVRRVAGPVALAFQVCAAIVMIIFIFVSKLED